MMDEYRLTGWQPKTDKIQSCIIIVEIFFKKTLNLWKKM
jgi:hypothetical protein